MFYHNGNIRTGVCCSAVSWVVPAQSVSREVVLLLAVGIWTDDRFGKKMQQPVSRLFVILIRCLSIDATLDTLYRLIGYRACQETIRSDPIRRDLINEASFDCYVLWRNSSHIAGSSELI